MKEQQFAVELDATELAVILTETACGIKRPAGMSAHDAWQDLSRHPHSASFLAQAHAAITWFGEKMNGLERVQ